METDKEALAKSSSLRKASAKYDHAEIT